MKKKAIALIGIFSFILLSCMNVYSSEEELITKKLNLEEFSNIQLSCSADVEIVKSDEQKVVIKFTENIEKYLDFRVEGSTFIMNLKNRSWSCCFKRYKLSVTIYTPKLNKIRNSGSGNITCSETLGNTELMIRNSGSGNLRMPVKLKTLLVRNSGSGNIKLVGDVREAEFLNSGSGDISLESRMNKISIRNSGSGEISLKGEAKTALFKSYGSGDFRAYGFAIRNLKLEGRGSGDFSVNVSGRLDVRISGSGDVRYKGNPKTSISISGSGRVRSY
ncbi:MAG: DUF2807 domain-containing protein [Marinifilaceae bacterium]|nr:DUF2807 domain-containing protein [Marinifilaceae bacterium]